MVDLGGSGNPAKSLKDALIIHPIITDLILHKQKNKHFFFHSKQSRYQATNNKIFVVTLHGETRF